MLRLSVIFRILSRLLLFAAASLLPPTLIAIANEESLWCIWLGTAVAFGLLGGGLFHHYRTVADDGMRRREGFFSVVVGWLILVLATTVAFYLSGYFPTFAAAWFESMSGFTTTGASVFSDVEALPSSIVFQRAFSHWIGGMGIIVLTVAILPELRVGGMQLVSAESSGIESEKLTPRIVATARRLWTIYLGLTLVEVLLLWAGGLSFFESWLHAFATVATGGFSNKNASVGAFGSLYVEIVIMIFMFLSGMSFALHYRALTRRTPVVFWKSPEVRLYTGLTFAIISLITWDLLAERVYTDFGRALRDASFQSISILTTTGFVTADFNTWPDFSRLLLVVAMFIGGCAGSTAGGSKVVRLYVVAKYAMLQLKRLVRPRLVAPIRIGKRDVSHETVEGILGFYWLYFAAIVIGGLTMAFLGMDLISGFTAAVSALNSIGPGLGSVGATQNFGHIPESGLYLLSFGMLLGRLEIYTVLVLFTVHFWRRG